RGLDPADAGQDEVHYVEVDGDALLLGQRRLLEVELPALPLEQAVDDLADLELHALPQVLRRERTHLDQHATLPLAAGERADRGLVLLHGALALADQDLPQAVVRQV